MTSFIKAKYSLISAICRWIEGCGAAYPFLVPVMIDAHHFASSKPHQRKHGLQPSAIRPEIENAYLRLRRAVRGIYDRLKANPLLHQIFMTSLPGNGSQILVRRRKLNSFARK